jgi:hypothetical protein
VEQNLSAEAQREIDHRIQRKGEKVLELGLVDILRRGNYRDADSYFIYFAYTSEIQKTCIWMWKMNL